MNKKYLFLIILSIITLNIKNVYAIDISNFVTNNENTYDTPSIINDDSNNTDAYVYKEYSYTNEETNYKAIIEDKANLLSLTDKEKLFDEMKPLTKFGHIAFVSTDNNYNSVETFSDNYYHTNFGTESGTIFVIDMSNRKIYIFSDGANYRVVTSSKAYSITDNTYSYATREDYYGCASLTYKQIYTILDGGKIAEPMRYTSNIFIALTLALFFSFLYVLSKSKMSKASVKSIVDNCDIQFEIGETSSIKTGQHRVYSPQSSGGGSSGGGGGGGGGSGGGGGHGF